MGRATLSAPWKKTTDVVVGSPESFQARLVTLAERARVVDLRSFEEGTLQRLTGELVPVAEALLEDGVALLGEILDRYDSSAAEAELEVGGSRDFYHQADKIMERPRTERLCDVAFLARNEMRIKREQIKSGSHGDAFPSLIALCASSLRRISKTTSAVENALCECEEMTPRLSFITELLASLQVRRAYAKFRSAVLDPPPPTPETVRACLLGAGAAIARLLGRDVYRDMRYGDRAELRRLQGRMLAWLNDSTAGAAAGQRLWQDLAGFAELLHEINRRSELVEHDREVAQRAWKLLFDAEEVPGAVPSELRGPLTALYGRGTEIDRLILDQSWNDAEAWRAPLSVLLAKFGATRHNRTRRRKDSLPGLSHSRRSSA